MTGKLPQSRLLSLNLTEVAPAGHYLAIRVGFAFPMQEVNGLPEGWVEYYTSRSYLIADPVIRWAHSNEGVARWSALSASDTEGVLVAARLFKLDYGMVASVLGSRPGRQRSFGIFLRSDREFTDREMRTLWRYVSARHQALASPMRLTPAEIEALRMIKEGQRIKQIAFSLGVSEQAIKHRLKNARIKLEAKTGAEALSLAVRFGVI